MIFGAVFINIYLSITRIVWQFLFQSSNSENMCLNAKSVKLIKCRDYERKLRWSFKCTSIKLKVDHSYQSFIWSVLLLVAMCSILKKKIRIDTCACNIKSNCILRSKSSKRVHCIMAVCINIWYIDIKRCLGRNELPNSY